MFILRLETFAPVTDDKAINAVSTLSVPSLAGLSCFAWLEAVRRASYTSIASDWGGSFKGCVALRAMGACGRLLKRAHGGGTSLRNLQR